MPEPSQRRRLNFTYRERAQIVAMLCGDCGQDVPLDGAEVCAACFADRIFGVMPVAG